MANNEGRYRSAEQRLWRSLETEATERRIRLEPYGVDVRLQEVGEGPPVLFIHGGSSAGGSWAPLVALLDDFRCLVLDRPGCGLSEPLPMELKQIADVEPYADRLAAAVLDALDLPEAGMVSTSYGGYFGLRGSAANLDRISRHVVFGWTVGAPMAKVPMVMRIGSIPALGRVMAKIPPTRASVRMMLRQIGLRGALESGRFTDEALDWFVALLRDTETLGNELRSAARVVLPRQGMNEEALLSSELLATIETPTFFLWGEDDPNGGAEIAKAFTSLLPNAELELRPGVGHAPWIDEPAHSAEVVRRFLSS